MKINFLRQLTFYAAMLFLVLVLAGCGTTTPASTSVSTETITTPTITATQTLTPTPIFTPTITPTPIGGGSGKIVFSLFGSNGGLYTMNSDGRQQRRIFLHPVDGFSLSQDGKKITFEYGYQVYRIDLDGTGLAQLTTEKGNFSPEWSPDGNKIALMSEHYCSFAKECYDKSEIYMMNNDGSGLTRLTDNDWGDVDPVWSPDGQKILFMSWRNGDHGDIYLMNRDGSEQTRLTNNFRHNRSAVWSPDGKRIAYVSYGNGIEAIQVINADGSKPSRLTTNPGREDGIKWSPDGQKIAFEYYDNGRHRYICVVNSDGRNQDCFPEQSEGHTGSIGWSPDGNKIAFISRYNIDNPDHMYSDILIMNLDGGNLARLARFDQTDIGSTLQWIP